MIIDKDEILPVVSLEEGQPYAVYDQDGRILLYTFHKYPDSYPDGADVIAEIRILFTIITFHNLFFIYYLSFLFHKTTCSHHLNHSF